VPLQHGPVTRVDEVFFETRDGCRLSARLWLPAGVNLLADAADAADTVDADTAGLYKLNPGFRVQGLGFMV
jgi:hypothetical protein